MIRMSTVCISDIYYPWRGDSRSIIIRKIIFDSREDIDGIKNPFCIPTHISSDLYCRAPNTVWTKWRIYPILVIISKPSSRPSIRHIWQGGSIFHRGIIYQISCRASTIVEIHIHWGRLAQSGRIGSRKDDFYIDARITMIWRCEICNRSSTVLEIMNMYIMMEDYLPWKCRIWEGSCLRIRARPYQIDDFTDMVSSTISWGEYDHWWLLITDGNRCAFYRYPSLTISDCQDGIIEAVGNIRMCGRDTCRREAISKIPLITQSVSIWIRWSRCRKAHSQWSDTSIWCRSRNSYWLTISTRVYDTFYFSCIDSEIIQVAIDSCFYIYWTERIIEKTCLREDIITCIDIHHSHSILSIVTVDVAATILYRISSSEKVSSCDTSGSSSIMSIGIEWSRRRSDTASESS